MKAIGIEYIGDKENKPCPIYIINEEETVGELFLRIQETERKQGRSGNFPEMVWHFTVGRPQSVGGV